MKNLRFSLVGLAAVLIAITALNLSGLFDAGSEYIAPDPADMALDNLGRGVYAEHCASCHGAELEGEKDWKKRHADGTLPAPPHNATGHTWHHADDLLLRLVTDGGQSFMPKGSKSNMPAYRDILSPREIAATLAFIKSSWPVEILQHHRQLSEQARKQ